MITDKEGMEGYRKMNTHKCETCGEIFINFKGMDLHVQEHGHHDFKLVGDTLGVSISYLDSSLKTESANS
jgi:hypothetical protein